MYETSDIRKGLKIQLEGVPYSVVDCQFVKPGKGVAFTRTKLKNMMTGAVIERTYRSGEKFEPANLEEREMQFIYVENNMYVFMDSTTYDQMQLSEEQLGDNKYFLKDGIMVDVLLFDQKPIGVTPPNFVELKVISTEPGFKGDTSSGGTKSATLETGLEVNVPLFINEGEILRIDTRTSSYTERAKK